MSLRIQEWIYKLEVGEGSRAIKVGALALGIIAIAAVYNIREARNFSAVEAMDSAQLARNIAQGKGFTTDFIRPLSLTLLDQHLIERVGALSAAGGLDQTQREQRTAIVRLRAPHPDVSNPPVYPAVLAVFMRLLPFDFNLAKDQAGGRFQPEVLISLFNQLLLVGVLAVGFLVARRLFDSAVAWVSTILMAASDLLWQFAVSGLSTMLVLFLFIGLIWALVVFEAGMREGGRSNRWLLAVTAGIGLLVGVGCLTRYSFGWFLIPVAAAIVLWAADRWSRALAACVIAFLVVVSPWLVRNYGLTGHLFGTAGFAVTQQVGGFSGTTLERSLGRDLALPNAPGETTLDRLLYEDYARKFLANVGRLVLSDLPRLGGTWVAALFMVGFLVPFQAPALRRIRWLAVSLLVTLGVVQAMGRTYLSDLSPDLNTENLLVLMTPLVLTFGVAVFFVLLDQIEFEPPPLRTLAVGGFSVLMSLPLVLTLLPPRSIAYVPPYNPALIQYLCGMLEPQERMISDMPWAVAWYGNRPCIWLTLNPDRSFAEINDYRAPVHALYLTQVSLDRRLQTEMIKGPEAPWGNFFLQVALTKEVPRGFPLQSALTDLLPQGQFLLMDRRRWAKESP